MATIPDVLAMIEDLSPADKMELASFIHESHLGMMSLCVMMGRKDPNDMGDVARMMLPGILNPQGWDNHLRAKQLSAERKNLKRASFGPEGVDDGKEG